MDVAPSTTLIRRRYTLSSVVQGCLQEVRSPPSQKGLHAGCLWHRDAGGGGGHVCTQGSPRSTMGGHSSFCHSHVLLPSVSAAAAMPAPLELQVDCCFWQFQGKRRKSDTPEISCMRDCEADKLIFCTPVTSQDLVLSSPASHLISDSHGTAVTHIPCESSHQGS